MQLRKQWVGLPPTAKLRIIGPEFKITRLLKIQSQQLDLRLVKKASHFPPIGPKSFWQAKQEINGIHN